MAVDLEKPQKYQFLRLFVFSYRGHYRGQFIERIKFSIRKFINLVLFLFDQFL